MSTDQSFQSPVTQQDAEDHEQATADPHDQRIVPLDPADAAGDPAQAEPDQDERDARGRGSRPCVRTAPRSADASVSARLCTAARVGPMHGVQPSPNRTPSIGAPIRPMVGARWMRHSRADPGSEPMNARPRGS